MLAAAAPLPRVARPLLLVSDLDDTLLPHSLRLPGLEAATARLKAVLDGSRAAGVPRVRFAINTGRTLPLFEAAWTAKQALLPAPDALITAVGTRVYWNEPGRRGWQADAAWTQHISDGWDADAARAAIAGLVASFGADSVVLSDAAEQNDHKHTLRFAAHLREPLLAQLREQLQACGLDASARVIEGPAGGEGVGWRFIDLIPSRAGKGAAMEAVRARLGFDDDDLVAAGDAPNDLLMLQTARHAIVVGNAAPEVKAWAAAAAAQGGQQVYVAAQPVAAGLEEGLAALGWLG